MRCIGGLSLNVGFLIVARHGRCLLFWWVDPSGGGRCGRLWGEALEADGMCSERGIEGDGALLGERRGGAVVDGGRSHQADAAVAMFVIVPVEEVPAAERVNDFETPFVMRLASERVCD